jgi:hypothetical protein
LAEQDGMPLAKHPTETKNMDIMTAGRAHVEKKFGVLGDKCQIKFGLGLKTQILKF